MSESRFGALFPEIWNVPVRHKAEFLGRDGELQTIIGTLEQNGIAAVAGEHGMGKTTLVAEFAYRRRGEYASVVWVDGAKGAQESCETIVRTQGLLGKNPISEINELLGARGGKNLWILNEFSEVPAELNSPNSNRHILLASKDIQQPTVTLGPLTVEQGAEVILRRSGKLTVNQTVENVSPQMLEAAKTIAEAVDSVPQTLVGAGRYIEETGSGVIGFARLITDNQYRDQLMQDIV